MDRRFMFMKKMGVVCSCPGAICILVLVYDHNIQTSFFSETAWPVKAKLYVEHR